MVLSVTKWLFGFLAVLVIVILFYAFALPRPADTTDPAIFMKDGRSINYCDLPVLDGSGKSANDIPKAYTPDCSYTTIPMPILAECTEPLAEGVVDMRGLWLGISDGDEHLERIEQCGNRVVITAFGIVHDFRVDGTLKNGARDVGIVCNNFNSAIHFDEEGVMVFRLFDLFDTVFREMRNEQMIFTFINGNEISTKRICQYQ
ncbi:MAG: hypothetical protein CMD59_02870 [Gammaproteobacteria bacterium]|nr:hypothetical protein [Gammaproteobacteria bacterium]